MTVTGQNEDTGTGDVNSAYDDSAVSSHGDLLLII
jgi:hypothetical protein